MNEELIRQCAREVARSGDDLPVSLADRAIRLCLARHVAPLVEAVRDFKEHGVIGAPDSIERMYNALSAFDTGTPQPSPDVARLVEAAQEARYFVHTMKFMNDEHDEARRAVFGKLTTALAPFQQEKANAAD